MNRPRTTSKPDTESRYLLRLDLLRAPAMRLSHECERRGGPALTDR